MFEADVLRVVVLAVLFLAVAGVGTVMRLHYRAWRRLPRDAGLTPLHVALVSLGVLIWGGTLAWGQVEALGREVTPALAIRTGLYGLGGVIILAALAVVGGLQRRRVQFIRSEKVVVSSAETVAVDRNRHRQEGRRE